MTRVARACLGVDIGTTSLAAVITDGRGKILASRTMANPSAGEPTAEDVHEQNPEAILEAVNALIARCEFFCAAHASLPGLSRRRRGAGTAPQVAGLFLEVPQ